MVKEFNIAKRQSVKKYIDKTADSVINSKRSNVHRILKKIGARPGENNKIPFSLPEHENMTNQEICNDLAKFFSQISQEYDPLNQDLLPERVRNKLNSENLFIPILEPFVVHENTLFLKVSLKLL